MARLVILIILALVVTYSGVLARAHVAVTQSGIDPDTEQNVEIGFTCALLASFTLLAGLIARLNHRILLSKHIVFRLFFYGWRNFIYAMFHNKFYGVLLGIETETRF